MAITVEEREYQIEQEIDKLVKRWIEAGWLTATIPELFIIGTDIKNIILKKA